MADPVGLAPTANRLGEWRRNTLTFYQLEIGNPAAPASGVIVAVALEVEPVPTALVAVTVQVYAVSLVNPLIVMGELVLVPV